MRPALEHLRKKGYELAKAEHAYRIALRQEVLRERAREQAVGVIDKTVYGEETVGTLRVRRDISKVDYDVAQELILLLKIDIKILDNQIAREWHNNDA